MAGDVFTVTVEGDKSLIGRFTSMPERLVKALTKESYSLLLKFRTKLIRDHLSGPTGPHSLSVGENSKTHTGGQLRRSVTPGTVVATDAAVTATIGFSADVTYAAIHEFGGVIHVPEIVPTNAKALHFWIGGKEVFAKRIRAHTINMPERAPLRTTLKEMEPVIRKGYEEAAKQALVAKEE